MLKIGREERLDRVEAPAPALQSRALFSPASMVGVLRARPKQSWLILLAFLALGIAYIHAATPLFMATGQILIDPRRTNFDGGGGNNRSLAELGLDSASIDSQVAVLSSDSVAAETLKHLHLEHDASFAAPTTLPGKVVATVKHLLGRDAVSSSKSDVPANILEGFQKRLYVARVAQTYVLSVSFYDENPARAAVIANEVINSYISDQMDASSDSRRVTISWLNARINDAREEVAAAEQAVRSVKIENGLSGVAGLAISRPRASADQAASDGQAKLRDLARDLDNRRMLYEGLVSRLNSLLKEQSPPVSSAAVLAAARTPLRKSQPNLPLILTLSILAGLAAALATAIVEESADGTLRAPTQLEDELGLRFLGVLPVIKGRSRRAAQLKRKSGGMATKLAASARMPLTAYSSAELRLRFTETLRAAKTAADIATHHDALSVIGVVSAVGREGRSTVATNLGDLIASSGRRVLVVDADLRRPSLSDVRASTRQAGLVEVMAQTAYISDAIVEGASGASDFLPALGNVNQQTNVRPTINLADLQRFLSSLAATYDYVVLDLPPLSSLTEVNSITPAINAFLLVVSWGETPRAVVAEALRYAPLLAERTVGAVLNRVDLKAFRRAAPGPRDSFYVDGLSRG